MGNMSMFRILAVIVILSFGVVAKSDSQSDMPSARLDGKTKGIILTLACEPIAKATITFTNKRKTQIVTPNQTGHFIADLPVGDYLILVSTPNLGEVKSQSLYVQRGKNGEVYLLVNAGLVSTCPCFGYDVEDMLIPERPMIINEQIQEKKVIPQP
jgi:hypothetical protein